MRRMESTRSGGGRGGARSGGRGGPGGARGGARGGTRTNARSKDRALARGASKPSRFIFPKDTKIEYKNLNLLQKFLSDRGKIVAHRISGVSAREQRLISSAIKHARFLALLPTGGVKK